MNPNPTSHIVVGIDDGYAMTKVVVFENGHQISQLAIPARARSGIHGATVIDEIEDEGAVALGYETDGVSYTVGDFADSESARFDDYPFSGMNRVIVHHALRLAGLGGRQIRIATGLPLSSYYQGSKTNAEMVARKDASIRTRVRPVDGSDAAVILDHKVFPEGLAAWIDHAIDEQGGLRANLNETVAVIDIGGRTTDIAVVLPGKRIDHARSGSADIGVLNLIEAVGAALHRELGVEVPAYAIDRALRTRTISVWGKKKDVGALIDAAAESVMERIYREINRKLGSAIDIDRILLVGGGARVFGTVAGRYPNIQMAPDPEYANARGFVKYLAL